MFNKLKKKILITFGADLVYAVLAYQLCGGCRARKTYESSILKTGEFEIHQEGLRV
jgi:hypothetical protein